MGLFTSSSSASRRPTSAVPLKRRSLGRSRESLSKSVLHQDNSQAQAAPSPNGAGTVAEESVHQIDPQIESVLDSQSVQQLQAQPSSAAEPELSKSTLSTERYLKWNEDEDEEADPELADLQSDNTFLYDRQLPLDSALGTGLDHPPKLDLLQQIDAYVAEHHLDCLGITHHKELVRHDNRLVPFFAKAPRFLSIHSLKRKELDRDYTDVADTADTCPRKELCLGRCLLGFSCPTRDLSVDRSQTSG